jgi:hypothetical protein
MTSCAHKMYGRMYGQTNMKRAMTRKNQPSMKSVLYAHAQIMVNQDTKYE